MSRARRNRTKEQPKQAGLPAEPRSSKGRVWWTAALFGVLATLAFGPAVSAPFDFDDLPAIVHNASIRALWPPSRPLRPPGLGSAVSGRPIANYSFALTYALNQRLGITQTGDANGEHQTIAYHATTMVLHVAVALLLFGVVRRTIRFGRVPEQWRDAADRIGLIAAAIWMVHPIQTEAVDYISQRTEVLVSFWYILTVYASLRSWCASQAGGTNAQRNSTAWAIGATACCLFGMGTKEVMLTAPLVVLLFDRAFLYASWMEPWRVKNRRALYVGLFVTTAWSLYLIASGGRTATVGLHLRISWYEYLYSQAWAIPHYLWLMAWPAGLTYDYGQNPIHGWTAAAGLIGLSALAAGTLVAWRRPALQWLGFLGAWFFILLAPSSSVVPIQTEIAAERRVYLAFAAVTVLVAIGVESLRRRLIRGGTNTQTVARAIAACAVVLVAILVGVSSVRSEEYASPESLWRDAVAKRPDNPRALNGLAIAELENHPKQVVEPDSLLTRAIAIDSTYLSAYVSKAAIAIAQSRLADAESLLTHVLRLSPSDSAATDKLGRTLLADGNSDRAVPYLLTVAMRFPSGETLTNLGVAYLSSGQLDSATAILRQAQQLDPTNIETMRALGGALIEQERGEDAVPYLMQVAQHEQSGDALGMLSLALAQSHRADESAQAAVAAVTRSPNDPAAFQFAGRAAQTSGKFDDAVKYLSQAMRLDPNDPQTLTRLGIAEASLGRNTDAEQLFNRSLKIAPGYERAQRALQQLRSKKP